MGLFSKKTAICSRCGKEFQIRLGLIDLCPECLAEEDAVQADVQGYLEYRKAVGLGKLNYEEQKEYIAHRTEILENHRVENGITRQELAQASDHYKSLSDDECEDILCRLAHSMITSTVGAAYGDDLFIPTGFEKMAVAAEDVFAVALATDFRTDSLSHEQILCALFTNDPYVPVFPMMYEAKLGFFDFMKSKKGREALKIVFEQKCHNLTYPVGELKELKKTIKKERTVNGKMDPDFALERISVADLNMGVFATKKLQGSLTPQTTAMLDEYGYILDNEAMQILKMDKMFNGKFWKKQLERIAKKVQS